MKLRTATKADVGSMLEIYRPSIEESAISFELEVPSLAEFERRLSEILRKFPWIVCEIGGEIAGYAYAGTFRSRPAYEWTVESTVYVKQRFHGRGVGKALYTQLLKMLKAQGVVNVIGGITLPNAASVGLHEHFGFVKVANFKDCGFKMGKWWDVGFWELQLQRPDEPKPLQAPEF